jgi:hypothetical protein
VWLETLPFPNKVNYYQPLVIKWFARVKTPNDSLPWMPAGTSSNLVYLIYDKVAAPLSYPWILQTFVDYGSRRATDLASNPWLFGLFGNAQTKAMPLLAAIWTNFSGRSARRAYDQKPLQYYGSWYTGTDSVAAWKLVWNLDGMCGAWVYLLMNSILAQGLTRDPAWPGMKYVTLWPKEPAEDTSQGNPRGTGGFLIKSWTFSATPSNAQNDKVYKWKNFVGDPMNPDPGTPDLIRGLNTMPRWKQFGPYDWQVNLGKPDVDYTKGMPAQNNNNPLGAFPNHAQLKIGNTVYDPSYGVTWPDLTQPANLLNFQNAVLDGYWKTINIGNANRSMLIRRVNTTLAELWVHLA